MWLFNLRYWIDFFFFIFVLFCFCLKSECKWLRNTDSITSPVSKFLLSSTRATATHWRGISTWQGFCFLFCDCSDTLITGKSGWFTILHLPFPFHLPCLVSFFFFLICFPLNAGETPWSLQSFFFFPENYNPHVLPGVKQQSYAGDTVLKGSFCWGKDGNTAVLGCMVKSHSWPGSCYTLDYCNWRVTSF